MEFRLFWSEMMMEHQLFLRFLLTNYKLKLEARDLEDKWRELILQLSARITSDEDRLLMLLLERTLSFQNNLLSRPRESRYLSQEKLKGFIEHINLESEYFLSLLQGDISSLEEIKFLAKENSQHEHFISSLLSGPNFPLREGMEDISIELKREIDEPSSFLKAWLQLSNKSLEEVELDVEEGESEIKIPLAMVQHELEEGKWEVRRLAYLSK